MGPYLRQSQNCSSKRPRMRCGCCPFTKMLLLVLQGSQVLLQRSFVGPPPSSQSSPPIGARKRGKCRLTQGQQYRLTGCLGYRTPRSSRRYHCTSTCRFRRCRRHHWGAVHRRQSPHPRCRRTQGNSRRNPAPDMGEMKPRARPASAVLTKKPTAFTGHEGMLFTSELSLPHSPSEAGTHALPL